jgi:anti-anti-sigma factor
VLVNLAGDVRGRTSEQFRLLVRHLISQGVKWMVMDCSDSRAMDSMALGVLLMAFRLCEHENGSVLLLRPSPDLVTLLEAMSIDRYFEMFPDIASVSAFLEKRGVEFAGGDE